ncbi:MAG TPA: hypothetical protein VMR21_04950 [Vicinamibacteria bacterium]|nr:hypothetical protein [Vicinamibacteria bacterium]
MPGEPPSHAVIRVETPGDGRAHRVSVAGLDAATLATLAKAAPAALGGALAVYTGAGLPGPDVPAVLGAHAVDEAGLHFRPRFPFVPGLRYRARFAFAGTRIEHVFEADLVAPRDPPRVRAVHPSGETLPENALRLYVQFSRPMNRRGAMRQVRLVGPDGREVPLAFVDVEDGLWDPGRTRLTLFLHPGRVKRGVAPGERLGPPLRHGAEYRLVVDGAMADAAGVAMGAPHEHRFRAVEADRTSPRAAEVHVEAPFSARGPVTVVLPEPLDHGLLRRWVWIEDARGTIVDGEVDVGAAETRWTFTPGQAWAPGHYAVRLSAALEDRAGNRFDRLFDRSTGATAPPEPGEEILRLDFEVRPD